MEARTSVNPAASLIRRERQAASTTTWSGGVRFPGRGENQGTAEKITIADAAFSSLETYPKLTAYQLPLFPHCGTA